MFLFILFLAAIVVAALTFAKWSTVRYQEELAQRHRLHRICNEAELKIYRMSLEVTPENLATFFTYILFYERAVRKLNRPTPAKILAARTRAHAKVNCLRTVGQ